MMIWMKLSSVSCWTVAKTWLSSAMKIWEKKKCISIKP